MAPKRPRVLVGFLLFAVLAILGLFVLHGVAGGVAAFAALLAFIGACMNALAGRDPEERAQGDRTGVAGWIGGWF